MRSLKRLLMVSAMNLQCINRFQIHRIPIAASLGQAAFLLLVSQMAWATALGPATVISVEQRHFEIQIPIVSVPGERGALQAGVSGSDFCGSRECQGMNARLERSGETAGNLALYVAGEAPEGKNYAEFQAWTTWESEGRLRGYVKIYKVELPASPYGARIAKLGAGRRQPDTFAASADAAAGSSEEIIGLMKNWAAAWSGKDVETYLGYYAADFEPPRGKSRDAWERERRLRIAGRAGSLEIDCLEPRVDMQGTDQARVVFRQRYRSATYASTGEKSLWLAKRNGAWRIIREKIDNEQVLETAADPTRSNDRL